MEYTPPLGNAAHFVTHGFTAIEPLPAKLGSRNYSPPTGNAVAAAMLKPTGYVQVLGNTANFLVIYDVTATGAATVDVTAEGLGEVVTAIIEGTGSASVDVSADGLGSLGVAGYGEASIDLDAGGDGAHGVAGTGAVDLGFTAAGVGVVERYEVRGEVRSQGILVNRLVRAYRRDTGELVGEASTVAGRFHVHAGFAAREHYIVPIDTSESATDWRPPCANRVVSVLAQDTA